VVGLHWTQKYDQEVHEEYPIHCYVWWTLRSNINCNKFK